MLIGGFLFGLGFFTNSYYSDKYASLELLNPFVDSGELISKPLLAYSIKNLQTRNYVANQIQLEEIINEEQNYTSFIFSYKTLGKKMTGQINIPDSITPNPEQNRKAIILLRGYVPKEIYSIGVGTNNVADAFANEGYITLAPDFFGYGGSDSEPEDTWQDRFEKPISVIELIKSVEEFGIPLNLESERTQNQLDSDLAQINNLGIWAHSNGGQIALTTLQILQKPIPTALWAPVTAPFPYSILYFSDELDDEGKEQRKWLAIFEENYDVFEFSLTQHLDSLTGPIQIQHGTADDAALIFWSQEFITKVKIENERREEIIKQQAEATQIETTNSTSSARANELISELPRVLDPIEINLITYANTNHNMVPNWNNAVQKDLQFFTKWLE
jgi:pimeloyl-ACP methyl ester carboxylesterase